MPLKSCLKKTCLPEVVPAAVPVPPVAPVSIGVVGPQTITSSFQTPPPSKRFDVTTVLLVIVVVGLVFGCILIFLLFRLRRMELQLQQTTKNFNMQTVREMIAQEIQDTVEQLEEQLMLDTVEDLEGHAPPGKQQGHQSLPFFVPLPNMQELNTMFESLVGITEVPPPIVRSSNYDHKIEELDDSPTTADVSPQEAERVRVIELEAPTAVPEVSAPEVYLASESPVFIAATMSEATPEAPEVCLASVAATMSEATPEAPEVCLASESPVFIAATMSEATPEAPEVCLASEEDASVPETAVVESVTAEVTSAHDNVSEASSVAGSPKVPSKRTRRTPLPRGKRKKTEEVPSVDL